MSNWEPHLRGLLSQWEAAERAEAEAKAVKADATVAAAQAAAVTEGLKAELLSTLLDAGVTGEPALGLSVTAGRATVEADADADPNDLPPDLIRWEPKPDKAAILKALQEGREVPGWRITTSAPFITRRKVKTTGDNDAHAQ